MSPCIWDLPVHGVLKGIGLDALGLSRNTETAAILGMSECCVYNKIDVPLTGMLSFTLIYKVICVFCQLWSSLVPIGVGALTLIRKHTLQLVVWKCLSACPDLVMLTMFTHILTYVACVSVGDSPPVDLVISGTDW